MASKKQRLFLWLAAACFALVASLLVALPWIYAWAVPHIMERQGVQVSSASHHPFQYLRLHNIAYKAPQSGIDLEVQSVELPAFYPFIFAALSGADKKSAIEIADWKLALSVPQTKHGKEAEPADTAAPLSPAEQVLEIRNLLHVADPWLSQISLRRGSVSYGEHRMEVPLIQWSGGELKAEGSLPQTGPFSLKLSRLTLPSPGLLAMVELPTPGISGELRALVPYLDSGALTARLSLQWKGGLAEAGARWEGKSWVPGTADFSANDFPIPPALVTIPNYAQPLVTLHAAWQEKSGTVRLRGHAESLTAEDPPLDWSLQAGTDTRGIEINTLQMNGPWLSGELGEPIRLEWARLFAPELPLLPASGGQTPAEPILRLVLDMDLADFPVVPLEGHATGVLSISTDAGGRVQADLSLESNDLSWQKIRLQSLRLQANLRGSVIRLIELDIRAGDGSYFTGNGSTDLSTRSVEKAEFKGNITDQFVLALGSALPQGENAEFVIEVRGPWTQITHAGQVRLNHIRQSSAGDHFDAVLQWEGTALDIPDIKLSAYGENIEADIHAAFLRDEQTRTDRVTLESARLKAGRYPAVTLEEPSVFTYYETDNTLELTPLKLTSDGQGYVHAHMTLPQENEPGQISLHAAQVSGRWLEIYRGAQLPCPIGIDSISADFQWRGNEWLRGRLTLEAHAEPGDLPPVSFTIDTTLDQSGIHIKEIGLSESQTQLLTFEADLPLAVFIDSRHHSQLRLLGKEPLHAKGELTLNNPALSQWLEDTFTLHLGALHSSLELSGTANEPSGTATLAMHSFAWREPPGGIPPLPRIESLQIEGALSPKEIILRSLNAQIGNAPLSASGKLPFDNSERRALIQEGKAPSFEKASATITTGDVPLRNFGAALPGMLRPMGFVNIKARLEPDFDLTGVFALRNASTRPLPPIGSIDNINAEIHLKDRALRIGHLDAQVGAQPVSIAGTADLSDFEHIVYDLTLEGGDLPIVRSPGLILRARPDITLKTAEDGTTTLGGSLELGQSFYTIDFTALATPGGGGSAESANNRPPYFSVAEQPMASWQLNLRLRGDEFLRIRTPVFEGIVSANFNLRGPLIAPYAFGNAEVDQGVVMFPYATLRVTGGGLSIRQDDPYTGRLDLTASGRAYGYDLRMHLTGTINDPNVQFDSSPSLDQAEVLMLLSTGQVPNAPERSAMSRLSGLGMFLGNSVLINLGLVDPLDDRFELLIGEDVTEKDQDTITVRYRLTDDWSVIGNYDRFDAYNLDLQWTIYRD